MQGRRPNYAWIDLSPEKRMERFMKYVNKRADGCWEWVGKRTSNNYGAMHLKLKPYEGFDALAHRVSYELHRGPIPHGMMILHSCDHPWCVNPSHLRPGSAKDNARDMISRGRTNYAYGERGGLCKLRDVDVERIRSLYATGHFTQRDLGERFKVSAKQISVIVNFKQRKRPTNVPR